MIKYKTSSDLIQCFIECMDQWFLHGSAVDPAKHPETFRTAIIRQNKIGWQHLFMGKLSCEWLRIHSELIKRERNEDSDTIEMCWGRAVIEHILRSVLDLWEKRNKELHGEGITSPIRKLQLAEEVRRLQMLREQARPKDAFLFIDDVEEYLKKATIYTMTTYIAMTRKAILKSVKQWKEPHDEGVVSVVEWIRVVPGNEAFIKQAEKRAREIWRDGRKKKRRRCIGTKRVQLKLDNFFSIYQMD